MKYNIINVTVTYPVKVPDTATHYTGTLNEEPTFYKKTVIAEYDYWWEFRSEDETWYLCGNKMPYYAKEIGQ